MDKGERFISEIKEQIAHLRSKRDSSSITEEKHQEFNQHIDDMENKLSEARDCDDSKWDGMQSDIQQKFGNIKEKFQDMFS